MFQYVHDASLGWSLVAALAVVSASCDNTPPAYTQFPVPVDKSTGGLTVSVDIAGDEFEASIDTLSPFTIVDRSVIGTPPGEPTREIVELKILDRDREVGGDPVTRALFGNVEVLALHPCQRDATADVAAACQVGVEEDNSNRAIDSIVGADLLARNAVRFNFHVVDPDAVESPRAEMSFFPDIAGDAAQRGAMCDAVYNQPFQGGGTAIVGGTEINVVGRRIAIDACFYPDDDDPVQLPTGSIHGVASLFVVSTGLAMTLISRTMYERYRNVHGGPTYVQLEDVVTLHLPSGPIEDVKVAHLNRLALVAEISDDRGPCEERYANDYLTRNEGCADPPTEACPCADKKTFCRAGAVAELSRTDEGFPVAVVPDDNNTLQALRNELRPESPEVSGIIGADVLGALEIDVDYPNARVLLRCSDAAPDGDNCRVRPQVLSRSHLQDTARCRE